MHPGLILPDAPPHEDFRWWTAAITVRQLPDGALPTAQTQSAKSSDDPGKQGKWVPKNLHVRNTVTVDGIKDDWEMPEEPIRTTFHQILDQTEELPALKTNSLDRRWRAACSLFNRRCFTNDPLKVAAWGNLYR